jgi:hypothetical protein
MTERRGQDHIIDKVLWMLPKNSGQPWKRFKQEGDVMRIYVLERLDKLM